ncbi:hypothetical protein Adt_24035 [Abeliophyllum distichum]|uniref:Uncharacterized protein n=1 Tax=Abeliophyllum distichum TaxID=126358 RepID=A0ABD1SCS8_9LAMI
MPLPIAFVNVKCTMQPIENNTKYFTQLVGNQVRFNVPPCYLSWTEVPEEQQARVQLLRSSGRSPDEYRTVYTSVDRLMANHYGDYKLKAHNHLKVHGPAVHTARCLSRSSRSALTSSPVLLSCGASLDKCAIANEDLRERRGHVRGVGQVPKDTSLSLDSTTASKAPQRTFHQFSGDP